MSRGKGRKPKQRVGKSIRRDKHGHLAKKAGTADLTKREKYFEIFVIAALFAFGVYHSVLYFGHTIVPNSDFPAFFKTGQELLSFQMPSSFKRVPVLGVLQVLLSYLVGGQHPALTAGWLLNAIIHPFNLILLWLVGREIVGKSALWVAIIAIINPQVLYLLTEPIVETTFLFFTLLTFYFLFKRSNWGYLFASITAMVRYEGAALILAAFVMDVIQRKSKRERIRAFLCSAMASVPLAIWMLGTFVNWQAEGSHYLSLFGENYAKLYVQPAESRTGVVKHIDVLWRTGFYALLAPYRGVSSEGVELLWKLSKTFAVISFSFGSLYGLYKRKWNILGLLIFFVPYFGIHTKFPSPSLRYHMPIFWIALLLSWFGFQSIWKLIDRNKRMPRNLQLILQASAVIIAIIWLVRLVPDLPKTTRISPKSASMPYVAITLVGLIFAGRTFIYKAPYLLRELLILALLCLVIVSNQFVLVSTIRDGQKEKEFKLLADWYVARARPGEKLGVYLAHVVRIFAPKRADYIVGLPTADNPSQFVKACYENDITYVVWSTREGLSTAHTGYRQLKLDKNIAMLKEPRSVGPYDFVTQVGWERGYVNVFRLRKPAGNVGQEMPSH